MKGPDEIVKKIADYRELIAKERAAGVIAGKDVLLALFRDYCEEASGDAGALQKFGLFISRLEHSRPYRDFVMSQIPLLEQLGVRPLTEFITDIDRVISDPQLRLEHKITIPHDPAGYFHALWVSFFINDPQMFVAGPAETLLQQCHREATQIVINETDHLSVLPDDVIYLIGRNLRGKDLIAFCLACKSIYEVLEVPLQKLQLLQAVETHQKEKVKQLLAKNNELIPFKPYQREQDPIVIACLDRRKAIYDALVASHLAAYPEQEQLLDFHYLVISGQRIAAERFLAPLDIETKKALIFGKGILGFSAIELSELEQSDIQMRLRFYRQLTNNPAQLAEREREIYQSNPGREADKTNWDTYFHELMTSLDEADPEYKARINADIENIKNNPALASQATNFMSAYQQTYRDMERCYYIREWDAGEQLWLAVGKLMRRQLARHHLWQYFRPGPFYNRSYPRTVLRTGFEAEPDVHDPRVAELQFHFEPGGNLRVPDPRVERAERLAFPWGANLFSDLYDLLGEVFSVFRGYLESPGLDGQDATYYPPVPSMEPEDVVRMEWSAFSEAFVANEEKTNTESVELSPARTLSKDR